MLPSEIFDRNQKELQTYLVEDWGLGEFYDGMVKARELNDENKLAWAAHYAWGALPDKAAIRYYPFNELCNMAEQIFGLAHD